MKLFEVTNWVFNVIETSLLSVVGRNITLLNEILQLATKLNYAYFMVLINLHLAHLMLKIDCVKEALVLVEQSLAYVMTNGGTFDKGRCLLLYAKCLVANANLHFNSKDKRNIILNAILHLDAAISYFTKVDNHSRVLDILYLKVSAFLYCLFKNHITLKRRTVVYLH